MKRVIFLVIFVSSGVFLWSQMRHAPQNSVMQIDPVFSFAQQDECADSLRRQSASQHNSVLQGVDQWRVQKVPFGAQIVCTADVPYAIINEVYALTAKGNLLPKNIFKENIVCALPHIVVKDIAQFESNRSAIVAFAQKLTSEITNRYAITWIRPSTVMWVDRECPALTLLSRTDQFVSQEHSQVAQKIYMKLGESQSTRERNGLIPSNFATMGKAGQKTMVIDLRFERHQVVKIGSGGNNGSFIG